MGLAGMCGVTYLCAPWFIDRALDIAGLLPLTGGIVTVTITSVFIAGIFSKML